jgi:hypothetical protein
VKLRAISKWSNFFDAPCRRHYKNEALLILLPKKESLKTYTIVIEIFRGV